MNKSSTSLRVGWLCLFFFIYVEVYGQFQASHWHFGDYNGIDFSTGAALTGNSAMVAPAGCASWSDSAGNLLFYSNGKQLYGKNHQLISGNLIGNAQSTQSVLFVPFPHAPDTLFLFVNAAYGMGGIHYYLLHAPTQSLLSGPFLLFQPTCEKLAAVIDANSQGFWLLTHEWNSNRFIAWNINAQGIGMPVYSTIGTPHTGSAVVASGTIRFNIQGTRVACALPLLNIVEVFDFQNGILSNPKQIPIQNPYGVCFSPNGQRLYITGYYYGTGGVIVNQVFQWNGTQAQVVGSWDTPLFVPEITIGDIQNAIDGKMYIAKINAQGLATIQFPDLQGSACNFILNAFDTPNQITRKGLPNFVQTYLQKPPLNFELPLYACQNDTVSFCITSQITGMPFEWSLDNQNFTSTQPCLNYAFSQPGNYQVRLQQGATSVSKSLQVYPKPQNPFSQPIIYACKGETVILDAQNAGASYFWSNGYSSQQISVNRSGLYSVRVMFGQAHCVDYFRVSVQFVDTPKYDLADTALCGVASLLLTNPFSDAIALWNDTLLADTFPVTQNGIYTVEWTRQGACSWRDTFQVKISPTLARDFPTDTTFCPVFEPLLLHATGANTYLWSNGQSSSSVLLNEPGTYWVQKIDGNGCIFTDTIRLATECNLLFFPNAFTPNADGLNDTLKPLAQDLDNYEMTIYDRSGTVLFKGQEWSGLNAKEDAYTVLLVGQWKSGKRFSEYYTVLLLR